MYLNLFSLSLLSLIFFSCRKEFDSPDKVEIPQGNIYTVKQLKQWYLDSAEYGISQDLSVYLTITADERSGNLYKTIYAQDATGSIALNLLYSGGIYTGDSIRLYLKGTRVRENYGLLVIDSVDTDKNVIKVATNRPIRTKKITLDQISDSLESFIVVIDSVQFNFNDAGKTFADAVNKSSKNTIIEDCSGNSMLLRNSGYANFASSLTPTGKGTLTAIVGEYSGTMQLYIRDINDLSFEGPRCPGTQNIKLLKDFEDNSLTSGGWITKKVVGTTSWTASTFNNDYFAKISNYSGVNTQAETWLISPAVDLTGSTAPIFSFENTCNYSGPDLEVFISTNYDGSSMPATATWTALNPILSSGSWAWVSSGNISLSPYVGSSAVYVAFKYTGTSSTGKTWEIDDIKISE